MSSKAVQIIGGDARQHAYVDGATNALLVKLVNPGAGGTTSDVNLAQYGGVAVGPTNGLHVQPDDTAVFVVSDGGGSLTVDIGGASINVPVEIVSVSTALSVQQGTSPWACKLVDPAGTNLSVVSTGGVVGVAVALITGAGGYLPVVDGDAVSGYGIAALAWKEDSGWPAFAPGVQNRQLRMTPTGEVFVRTRISDDTLDTWCSVAKEGVVAPVSIAGQFPMAVVGVPELTTGNVAHLYLDTNGRLHVNPGTVTVQDGGGSLTVDGTVTVQQATPSSLKALVIVQGGDQVYHMDVVRNATPADGVRSGPLAMFRSDSSGPVVGDDTWSYGWISTDGGILVHVTGFDTSIGVASVTPGTSATALGKAEDAVHATGDVGVMALAVRQDTLSSSVSGNGDYGALKLDSVGALWVRQAGVTTVALSGSTRGRPIQITGTSSGTANTLHTATTTSGQLDRVYIYLTNTSASAVLVTIEFGTTGTANELKVEVPPNDTILAVEGSVIGGAATDTIKAYAATGSVINAIGRVERLS